MKFENNKVFQEEHACGIKLTIDLTHRIKSACTRLLDESYNPPCTTL